MSKSSQPQTSSILPQMPWMTDSGFVRSSSSSSSSSSTCRNELENYLDTDFTAWILSQPNPSSDYYQFDLLNFWKQHTTTFPVVSKMARDILTILVFSVASKQVFSLSGRVLEERRTRLGEDILEALMCVKDWEDAHRRIQQQTPEEENWFEEFSNLEISDTSPTASTPTGSNLM